MRPGQDDALAQVVFIIQAFLTSDILTGERVKVWGRPAHLPDCLTLACLRAG